MNAFETPSGKGFVRPYEIAVSRDPQENSIAGALTYVHSVGSLVRLEIKRADNAQYVDVELGREQFNQLSFKQGETVYLKPTQLRVF